MRHTYVPLFGDFLTSSMWSQTAETRCVWIWFLLSADPEGYVRGTLPGVAQHAGVTLEQAEAAIKLLESPDPHSATTNLDGIRLVRVERGWHIVNFVAYRERARHEADKARKRAWAKKNYEDTRQLKLRLDDERENLDRNLDAPKSKSKPSYSTTLRKKRAGARTSPRGSKASPPPTEPELGPPPPPEEPERATPFEAPVLPDVVHELPDDFAPDDALRLDATVAGVPDLDARIAKLRTVAIGGKSGVLRRRLPDYIRSLFPQWRTWRETEEHKASLPPPSASPRGFRGGGAGAVALDTQKLPESVPGYPAWVHPEHAGIAEKYDIDLQRASRAYAKGATPPPRLMRPIDVREPFAKYLLNLARERGAA